MATWETTTEDVTQLIRDQNPWLHLNKVPELLAPPIERSLGQDLWQRLLRPDPDRYEIILGPRRVGKTTVMFQTVKHLLNEGIPAWKLWWFRLDHPILLRMPLGEILQTMLKTVGPVTYEEPAYVFLDELVYAREWDLWLKTFYDERYPIRVVATSSATAALRNRRLESGVGRWEEQYLMPYLLTEFLDLARMPPLELPIGPELHDTVEALCRHRVEPEALQRVAALRELFCLTGGFPELLLRAAKDQTRDQVSVILESQRVLRTDAIERTVYKDIPQTFKVDNPMLLERLLYTLAGQATGILSPKKVCGELDGLSNPTFDRYLAYLEHAFLVFTLPNYSGREASIQKRGRKLYFVDSAIRNAALQRGIAPLTNTVEMGVLLENLAASQLHALALQSQVRLFHWRDGQDEVDLVYNHPDHPLAFEIASSADHARTGLTNLMARHSRFKGRCYLVAPNAQPLPPDATTSGVGTLPLDYFLLAVGRQAEAALRTRLAGPLRDVRART